MRIVADRPLAAYLVAIPEGKFPYRRESLMIRTLKVSAALAVMYSAFVVASQLSAAMRTWDGVTGLGDGSNWTTSANWAGDIAPIPGADDLIFAVVNDPATNNDFVADSI